jgi:hypothetical protein
MNMSPQRGPRSSFEEKRQRAVRMIVKSLAQNAANKRTHPDILRMQQQAVRAFFYDIDEMPDALQGGPLMAVQRKFAQAVDQFSFRELPGMSTDWYPMAVIDLERSKARKR